MQHAKGQTRSSRLPRWTVACVLALALCGLGAAPTQSCGGPGTGGAGGGSGAPPVPICGNGKRENDEQCDGADLNGQTCATFNPNRPAGQLKCSGHCLLNDWDCMPSSCGNDHIDDLYEECDGSDLMGMTCEMGTHEDGCAAIRSAAST